MNSNKALICPLILICYIYVYVYIYINIYKYIYIYIYIYQYSNQFTTTKHKDNLFFFLINLSMLSKSNFTASFSHALVTHYLIHIHIIHPKLSITLRLYTDNINNLFEI